MTRIVVLCLILYSITYAQVENWIYKFNGQYFGHDHANSMTFGNNGYVYIAGSSKNTSWDDDFTVISLNLDGSERWVYTNHISGSTSTVAHDLTQGLDGNIYALGKCHCPGYFSDLLIVCLDDDGYQQWTYQSDSATSTWSDVSKIIYGNDGNLYAVGASNGYHNLGTFTIFCLDTNGTEQWIFRYDNNSENLGWAEAIIYGPDSNIYVCGRCTDLQSDDDLLVLCLDNDGALQWDYRYNGPSDKCDRAFCIEYGPDGNLYIAGFSDAMNPPYHSDAIVISLTTDGGERWCYRYNGPANLWDAAWDLDVGPNGNIYVCGITFTGLIYYEDAMLICLDQFGNEKWIYTYDGHAPRNNDHVLFVNYGLDDNLYIGGNSDQWVHTGNSEWLAISVDTNGVEQWVYPYHGTDINGDKIRALEYGVDEQVILTGYSSDSITHRDITVVSLNPITMIKEEEKDLQDVRKYCTFLTSSLHLPEDRSYKIFDITGRQIRTLDPAPGIYFIEVDGEIQQKVIKIR